MQVLSKSSFELTYYLKQDKRFADFWQILHNEAKRTVKYIKLITGQKQLLEDDPLNQKSIQTREHLVLPLLVIQQYALMSLRDPKIQKDKKQVKLFRKLVLKTLAANINASRNAT